MALIEIRDLVKTYDQHVVLNGVSLDVPEGGIKVIMGPSGCGKSTLLRCLNRIVEPTSGTIRIRNVNITDPSADVHKLRQNVGFVFQQFALYRHLSVLDNVTLALRKVKQMPRMQAREKAMWELHRFRMGEHSEKYPHQLSGGQKQRVALARALAMDPLVLVLDEPTSALDPIMSQEVADLVRQLLTENVTMLCVTHDLGLAEAVASEVTYLDGVIIKAQGKIEQLSLDHPDADIRAFFGEKRKQ